MPYIPANARAARAKKPGWITPTLTGATNVAPGYQGVRYTKMGGIVHIQGWVTVANTTATTMFTLPVGMRPALFLVFEVAKLAGGVTSPVIIQIKSSGAVEYPAGLVAGDALYLNGITFPADA